MFAKSSSHKYISTKTGTVDIKSPQQKNSDVNDDIDLPNFITKNSWKLGFLDSWPSTKPLASRY